MVQYLDVETNENYKSVVVSRYAKQSWKSDLGNVKFPCLV